MLAAAETGEVFALLEARDAVDNFTALYSNVREPWLTRALLMYHARTGSARSLELLARAPDAHARHLLDALLEQLRGERAPRHHALAALAALVARRPSWLRRLATHPLARDLMRAARSEREPLPLLHALLALAALLPAEPALAAPHWPDLADALLRPAALHPPPPPPARDHLLLAQLALFHALYATHPCTLIETLRAECTAPSARDAWERAVAPLIRSVRLHPALVTGSRQREADATRWAGREIHDVLAESRRLAVPGRDRADERAAVVPAVALEPAAPSSPAPGSAAQATRAASALRPGAEPWFALADRCGADSAPNTPLPADADATEPPEAAVEATPENTPAKDARAQFRFPAESAAVRVIGRRSQPPSPLRKETSPPADGLAGRMARVALERRAAESPVPFGGAPPPAGAVPRPEPRAANEEPLNVEDREVLMLTERARTERKWAGTTAAPRVRDPRTTERARARRRGSPARRGASCSARLPAARTASVAVQTVDAWPEPYEFLIADFYRGLPDEERMQTAEERGGESVRPCERLDAYLADLYSGRVKVDSSELAEQLALTHAQLMYERWRREAHAERNRRLLGRCREARALKLQNDALRERLRAVERERDELRARPAPPPPPAPAAPERERALEAALDAESAARLRAEAALREAETQRAADAAELRRTRGEHFEAARHVDALARAALAAERRAEHVRRLRRELLVLAEREARLRDAVRARAAGAAGAEAERAAAEERALRAALARAEAEAEAAAARADAAAARAHELDALLNSRDAAVAELKRAARHAGEEHAAELRALQDKYATLMRVVRAAEAHKLERLAGAAGAGGARVGGAAGAGVARVGGAAAECGRARRVLERADAEPEQS